MSAPLESLSIDHLYQGRGRWFYSGHFNLQDLRWKRW